MITGTNGSGGLTTFAIIIAVNDVAPNSLVYVIPAAYYVGAISLARGRDYLV